MEFKTYPFILDIKFFFQFIDNTLADITVGSDIVRINSDIIFHNYQLLIIDFS